MVESSSSSTTTVEASLEKTPTWAVAVVCSLLIAISILIEYALHLFTKFLKRRKRKSLNQALYKIRSELMLFGFMTLLLTVAKQPISKICIPKSMGGHFLPCKNTTLPTDISEEPSCHDKVVSCVLTMGLGMAKMKRWESWEEETSTLEYQFTNDPRRFRLTRQTSFGRRHLKFWSKHPLLLWPVCFLRQFYGSVPKTDYFILRHGFITAHFAEGSKFDFRSFIRRALEEDFQVVVGISFWIWVFSILFIFFNAHGFYNYFWLPFIPFMMALAVGTKLQVIITKMCLESRDESVVVRGTLLVKPNNNLFWFGRPHYLLHLIHFILFQNSFQLAFFTWTWYKFGLRSCFHYEKENLIIRIAMGVLLQLLIGYVTLPLYALVTQMGSFMRKVVFTEQVSKGLKNWHSTARHKLTVNKSSLSSPSPAFSSLQTIDTLLSDAPELEMTESEQPSPEPEFLKLQIQEEETSEPDTATKGTYDGEISFRRGIRNNW
ncbi:MLO-like protein 12 isoform X2 [Tasmannia lanceolata]|uniref:MLO-like protein 12 isoform X2 n=1 Tax=Tasmannia lanceolata TaxID=3420 RepID=UPI0040629E5D